MTDPITLAGAREKVVEIRAKLADWEKRAKTGEAGAEGWRQYYAAMLPTREKYLKGLEERSRSDHTQHG